MLNNIEKIKHNIDISSINPISSITENIFSQNIATENSYYNPKSYNEFKTPFSKIDTTTTILTSKESLYSHKNIYATKNINGPILPPPRKQKEFKHSEESIKLLSLITPEQSLSDLYFKQSLTTALIKAHETEMLKNPSIVPNIQNINIINTILLSKRHLIPIIKGSTNPTPQAPANPEPKPPAPDTTGSSTYFTTVTKAFISAVSALANSDQITISDFASLQRLVNDVQNATNIMTKGAIEKQKQMLSEMDEIDKRMQAMIAGIEAATYALMAVITIAGIVGSIFTGGGSGAAAAAADIAAVAAMEGAIAAIKAAVSMAINAIVDAVTAAIESLKALLESLIDSIVSAMQKVISQSIQETLAALAETIEETAGQAIQTALKELPKSGAEAAEFMARMVAKMVVAAALASPSAVKGAMELEHAQKLESVAAMQKVIGKITGDTQKAQMFTEFYRQLAAQTSDNIQQNVQQESDLASTVTDIVQGLLDAGASIAS